MSSIASNIVGGAIGGTIGNLLNHWVTTKRRATTEDIQRDKEALNLFIHKFGIDDRASACYIGRINLKGKLQWQPDHIAAAQSLLPIFGIETDNTGSAGDPRFGDPRGNIIVIGGPNSTFHTQIAWEFQGQKQLELTRDAIPIVPLRWWGQSNSKELIGRPRAAWNLQGFGKVTRENWPLFERGKAEPCYVCNLNVASPMTSEDGKKAIRSMITIS